MKSLRSPPPGQVCSAPWTTNSFASAKLSLEPQANGQAVKSAGRPTSPVLPAYSADLTRSPCRCFSVLVPLFFVLMALFFRDSAVLWRVFHVTVYCGSRGQQALARLRESSRRVIDLPCDEDRQLQALVLGVSRLKKCGTKSRCSILSPPSVSSRPRKKAIKRSKTLE